jgi:DNA-binding XRE family transcriptional regulator
MVSRRAGIFRLRAAAPLKEQRRSHVSPSARAGACGSSIRAGTGLVVVLRVEWPGDIEDAGSDDVESFDVSQREKFILLRRRTGVTQEQVSRHTGVLQPHLSSWERGKRELPPDTVREMWSWLEAHAAEAATEAVEGVA